MILRIKYKDIKDINGKLDPYELDKYINLYITNKDIDTFEIYTEIKVEDIVMATKDEDITMGNEFNYIQNRLGEKLSQPINITGKWDEERKVTYGYVFHCYK